MISTPDELALHRDSLVERAIDCLTNDDRTIAAWLGGSLGRNEEDAWSDIDLFVLVGDEHFDEFWHDRGSLFDAIAPQVLRQKPIPENSMLAGGNFQLIVFAGPVEIDWTIAPAKGATRPLDTLLLFERRPIPVGEAFPPGLNDANIRDRLEFFWAMAPVAVKYAARGDMLSAASMIATLRRSLAEIDRHATRPTLERLTKQIALVEIQQLCSEAVIIGDDRGLIGIANEVDRLILLAADRDDNGHAHG